MLTDELGGIAAGSIGTVISASDCRPGEETYLVRFEQAYVGVPAFALDLVGKDRVPSHPHVAPRLFHRA